NGGKDFRRTDQRRPVRGLGGDMPRPHTLARGDRRHGQSPRPQGAAGRATHQGGGRGVAISPSLQSRYEPHRKSLLQAQSLPAQTRRTDRRGSDPRPRNLRRNLQALRMYKLLQILRLSGRYRMIGFCSNCGVDHEIHGRVVLEDRLPLLLAVAKRRRLRPFAFRDIAGLGYPFNRTGRFVSKGDSTKVAPSWADVRVVSAAWEEQPLGSGS